MFSNIPFVGLFGADICGRVTVKTCRLLYIVVIYKNMFYLENVGYVSVVLKLFVIHGALLISNTSGTFGDDSMSLFNSYRCHIIIKLIILAFDSM